MGVKPQVIGPYSIASQAHCQEAGLQVEFLRYELPHRMLGAQTTA